MDAVAFREGSREDGRPRLPLANAASRRFRRLARSRWTWHIQGAQTDSTARFRATCRAYCEYGLGRPGHYKLLFESRLTGKIGVPYEGSPSARVFENFVDTVRNCIECRAIIARDPAQVATALLVSLHGIVSLRLSKPGFPWPPVDSFRDMAATVEEVVEGETSVVIRSHVEATHVGEFLGILATGRRIAWDAVAIVHTSNGRVVGMWSQPDLYGIYRQLTA